MLDYGPVGASACAHTYGYVQLYITYAINRSFLV